jgi:hypothetical protein
MGNATKEEIMLSYMSLTSIIMLHLVWRRIYTLVFYIYSVWYGDYLDFMIQGLRALFKLKF